MVYVDVKSNEPVISTALGALYANAPAIWHAAHNDCGWSFESTLLKNLKGIKYAYSTVPDIT